MSSQNFFREWIGPQINANNGFGKVVMEVLDYWDEYFIDRTNPTVMNWPLVGNALLNGVIIGIYIAFVVWLGPAWMRSRKAFDLRWLMIPYNAALVIANAIIFSQYAKIRFSGQANISCQVLEAIDDRPEVYRLAEISWWMYLTKYIELFDTIFFVLRKKDRQLSKLHLIHHSSVPLIMFGMLRMEPGGYNTVFPIANSFVHILMYTYYGISAIGDDVKIHLWFKKYITMCQLIQFVFVFYHMFGAPFYGCRISWHAFVMNVFIAGFFMILFINFYYHEYINKRLENKAKAANGFHHNTIKKEKKKVK